MMNNMSEIPETSKQFIDRKMTEILDLVESGKNSDAVITFNVNDTIMPTPSGSIPVIHINITLNENILRKWKAKK